MSLDPDAIKAAEDSANTALTTYIASAKDGAGARQAADEAAANAARVAQETTATEEANRVAAARAFADLDAVVEAAQADLGPLPPDPTPTPPAPTPVERRR